MLVVEKQFDLYLFLDQTGSNHVPLFCKIFTHYTVTITILISSEYFFPEILANEEKEKSPLEMEIIWKFPNSSLLSKIYLKS